MPATRRGDEHPGASSAISNNNTTRDIAGQFDVRLISLLPVVLKLVSLARVGVAGQAVGGAPPAATSAVQNVGVPARRDDRADIAEAQQLGGYIMHSERTGMWLPCNCADAPSPRPPQTAQSSGVGGSRKRIGSCSPHRSKQRRRRRRKGRINCILTPQKTAAWEGDETGIGSRVREVFGTHQDTVAGNWCAGQPAGTSNKSAYAGLRDMWRAIRSERAQIVR